MGTKKKKNRLIGALAAILAVTLAIGGGTYAYLQGSTTPVVNEFDTNKVEVELEETTGESYDIVPGTSQEKDPTITAKYTLDSYVYVEITDATEGLATWYIANGWTELTGASDADSGVSVYYMLLEDNYDGSGKWSLVEDGGEYDGYYTCTDSNGVTYYYNTATGQYVAVIPVLKDNRVYYSSTITNDQMEAAEAAGHDLTLDFVAYIIQADIAGITGEANESALVCWNVLTAGSSGTAAVAVENVAVTTDGSGTTTTAENLVVTSADSAYSAIVPAGTVIDTSVAEVTTDAYGNTTTTLILVVEKVGTNYTGGSTLSISGTQTADVYDISIIGVSENNTTVMEVALSIGANLDIASVQHEGDALTALMAQQSSGSAYEDDRYFYDNEGGILYIYTDTFSEFAVVRNYTYARSDGKAGYDSLEDALSAGCVAVNTDTSVVYTALETAVSKARAGETVVLLADVETSAQMNVSYSMTIDLNGYDVTQTNASAGAFYVSSASREVDVTITSSAGNSTITGYRYGVDTINYTSKYTTSLTVSNVTIITTGDDTTQEDPYGIRFRDTADNTSLKVENVVITAASSKYGYGIYSKAKTLTVTDTQITTNGQGIYNTGVATVTGCDITTTGNNSNGGNGYGIYNYQGTVTISGTKVTSAYYSAAYNDSGTMTVNGGSVLTNTGERSDQSYGIGTKGTGSILTVSDAVITGTRGINVYGTLYVSGDNTVITGEDTSASTSGTGIYLNSGSTLTVNDNPTIKGTNRGIWSIGSNVTINGGTISTTITDTLKNAYGIYSTQTSTVYINGGTIIGGNAGIYATGITLEVTGGEIIGTGSENPGTSSYGKGIQLSGSSSSPANVAISGGTIKGAVGSLYVSGSYSSCTVSGGSCVGKLDTQSSGKLTITGGSFTTSPESYVDADAYTVTEENGVYTVTAKAVTEDGD